MLGLIVDTAGAPVPLASVRLSTDGYHEALLSDATGHFAFLVVPIGRAQLEVRRLGFRPISRVLVVTGAANDALDSTRVILPAIAAELAGIEVSEQGPGNELGLEGFNSRRLSNNFGHYLDRAQLEATHAQRPSDALRGVPGVLVQPSNRIGNIVRIRNCRPTVWLDGVRIPDAELDEVTSLDNVTAVEVYKSLAGMPPQFIDRTNPCGAILLWSRHQ